MLIRAITGRVKAVVALTLCGVLVSMPVVAQRYSVRDLAPLNQQPMVLAQAGGESLDSAVSRVRRQTGGRVLSAETRQEDGQQVHYIRVITKNGKVKNIRVVAQPK
jgi:hypothetical protein